MTERARSASAATVLVVDDDREVLDFLAVALAEHGYEVLRADSGLKLAAILRAHRPDVILLDLGLPWSDGLELCRALKGSPRHSKIPVCIISGRTDPEAVRGALECGAAAYFPKPLDTVALLHKLGELCRAEPDPPEPASAALGGRGAP